MFFLVKEEWALGFLGLIRMDMEGVHNWVAMGLSLLEKGKAHGKFVHFV